MKGERGGVYRGRIEGLKGERRRGGVHKEELKGVRRRRAWSKKIRGERGRVIVNIEGLKGKEDECIE